MPVSSAAESIVIPPMWVIGNGNGLMSSSPQPSWPMTPDALAITEASVCWIPFGAAVVPEEK